MLFWDTADQVETNLYNILSNSYQTIPAYYLGSGTGVAQLDAVVQNT